MHYNAIKYKTFSITKMIILKFNSSSIPLLTMCISQCCHNRVLYWVSTDPNCFIYWAIQENIAQSARLIRRFNSSNIALPQRTIMEKQLLQIEKVCIMTQVGIYGEIKPKPSRNPLGSAHGISLMLRLYFTIYISSRHSTNTIQTLQQS